MLTNNESSSSGTMNQTMSPSFDLNKATNLQSSRDFRNSQHHFLSNLQNVSQNSQHFRQSLQDVGQQILQPQQQSQSQMSKPLDVQTSKLKIEQSSSSSSSSMSRNLNLNQKSMISPEIHTHFKKQKIQNLKNEDYLSSASSSSTNQTQPLNSNNQGNEFGLGAFSEITQQKQLNSYPHNEQQLTSKPQNVYSESQSSESSSNRCSPEPNDQMDHQFPMNLSSIKGNQDTSSSSSNETKEDFQLLNDAKIDCSSNMSSLYSTLILPANQKFPTQSTNNDSSSNQPNLFDNIELVFTKQPAKYHRARYMTEGKFSKRNY